MADRQQINLYQPTAGEGKRPFSARAAAISIAVVVASVLGIWGYGTWEVSRVQRSVSALEQQKQRQDVAVTAVDSIHAARANPAQLQAQVKELTAQVDIRRHALELLQQGAEGDASGFSGRLSSLAHSHVDGLWIDHVVLSGSDGTMTLEGIAADADLVPRFLNGLSRDHSLSGVRFEQLAIERSRTTPASGSLHFRVQSRPEDPS
ncbi:MAG TPA: hypothetical protein VGM84_24960 [Steroidobacteraceae bacterium]|jgi:Tfp pilus assembly protein PilN